MPFVDGEGRFLLGAFAKQVNSYFFRKFFSDYVAVAGSVKIKRQQLHGLAVYKEGFDYVVADAFAAAVDVKVWVNHQESCQVNITSGLCGLHSSVAVYEVYL